MRMPNELDLRLLTLALKPFSAETLVSCLCLTRGNYNHLWRAIECFLCQTYRSSELVVVHAELDERSLKLREQLSPAFASRTIRFLEVPRETRLGKRRNFAYAQAQGEYFAIWDDDDWHAPERLERQMRDLTEKGRAASVLERVLVFDELEQAASIANRRPWENTLICRREIPRFPIKWPEIHRGEDSRLVRDLGRSARLALLDQPELYVYTFHGGNVWNQEHHRGLRDVALSSDEARLIGQVLKGQP